ncbi:MAG: twin-arginine translocation signal domain-containing protein [Bacteroidetes bacterium]|nr:MAG: twin-arginine translocation signal domain-containing protein [Bacteroidota bacterium]
MHQQDQGRGSVSRRDFMKTSALAAGGVVMSASQLAGAHLTGAGEIKIGLIGCGGRGTGAAMQALSTKQNVKLVAMADAFRDRLDQSLANMSNPEYSDYTGPDGSTIKDRIDVPEEHKFVGFDAYKKVIPLCDVVLIATPPGFRPEHFEAAVAAGKHVFMEKPVATDAPGVRRVLAAAEEAKKKKLNVVVGLQRHYQTVYREWVERLHNGAIGDIHTARVYWNSGGVWVRDRATLEKEAGRKLTEMEYQMRNWYYYNWLCGDHITEQHIHNLDVGNWVMQKYPVRASGMGGREVRKGKDHGEIFDHHYVEYEYADGSRMISQCRHIKGCVNRVSEAFHGSGGMAPEPGTILTPSGYTIWKHRDRNDPNPYQVEHDELFAAIEKGEYKYEDATNGAKATMTAILGRMATYSGQLIEWDDAINSELSLMPKKYAWDAEPPVKPGPDGFYPVPVPGVTKVL